jgi:imidazoleglycerol phosphate dehydratase HisB
MNICLTKENKDDLPSTKISTTTTTTTHSLAKVYAFWKSLIPLLPEGTVKHFTPILQHPEQTLHHLPTIAVCFQRLYNECFDAFTLKEKVPLLQKLPILPINKYDRDQFLFWSRRWNKEQIPVSMIEIKTWLSAEFIDDLHQQILKYKETGLRIKTNFKGCKQKDALRTLDEIVQHIISSKSLSKDLATEHRRYGLVCEAFRANLSLIHISISDRNIIKISSTIEEEDVSHFNKFIKREILPYFSVLDMKVTLSIETDTQLQLISVRPLELER